MVAISLSLLIFPSLLLGAAPDTPSISPRAQERLQREVRRQLVALPYYGVFDHLAFRLDGYQVTLLGEVTSVLSEK